VHNNRRAQYLGLRRLCTRCTPFYTTRSTRYTTVGYAREWIETALEIESGRHKASCAPLPATAMALRRRSVTPSRRHRRTVHRQRDALRQTFVSRRHELSDQLQQRRQRDHAQEVTYSNLLFSQRLLCVSRACLDNRWDKNREITQKQTTVFRTDILDQRHRTCTIHWGSALRMIYVVLLLRPCPCSGRYEMCQCQALW
jgi:hypothetical protein